MNGNVQACQQQESKRKKRAIPPGRGRENEKQQTESGAQHKQAAKAVEPGVIP
jgi:hypothetical protein